MPIVRPATERDFDEYGRFVAEFRLPDPPLSREAYVERVMPSAFFVCEGERAVGYGFSLHVGERYHVVHVATLPDARERGVGRAVMDEHARRARAAGFRRWYLNVRRDNPPAIRLYERCGMRIARKISSVRVEWSEVGRLAASPDADAIVIGASDDAAIERRFSLSAGELAGQRARAGRVIVAVRANDVVEGWASFDPAFPGAAPFQPKPGFARGLLEAIRAHARSGDEFVRVMVEDDAALERALVAIGGRVMLDLYRMEGDVPG
jgi:ribosomal protein S18 acetylase RimI-like enzyme